MTRVFISSTGLDLTEYRAAVIETCNRAGMVPVAMELFEAMGAGATEASLRKLREADLFVFILAHRYGYVEPGYDRSVVHLEFERAGELGLERLCFLVRPGYSWSPEAIDFENRPRLKALREQVERTVVRNEFTTVDDLRAKVLQSLVEWLRRHRGGGSVVPGPQGAAGTVPARPPLFIGRDAQLAEVRESVGAGEGPGRGLTIVKGWPGVGKTTLVNALSHDERVRARYPDAVFWISLGEKAVAASELAALCRRLGACGEGEAPEVPELIRRVRAALQARPALLVIDDVWSPEDAVPFKQAAAPGSALLVTTRFEDVARQLADLPGEQIYRLGVLSDDEGVNLLERLSPTVARRYPDRARELVRDLEGLPLALRVVGRLLEAEAGIGADVLRLMDELRDSHRILDSVAPDDRFDPRTGTTPTVQLLLKSSSDRLDPETRERFALLGVFAPKPATFDPRAMQAMWEVDDPFPTIRVLVDRGLLEPIVTVGRFQMHALLVKHAQSLLDP